MIFLIAMLVFGPAKIVGLGKGLGGVIRDFRKAVQDGPSTVRKHMEERGA